MPVKIIASSLALIGFMVAAVTGAIAGNPVTTTITRALAAMGVCYLVGLGLGRLGQVAVREHIDRYKDAHPIPDIDPETGEPIETESEAGDQASGPAPEQRSNQTAAAGASQG